MATEHCGQEAETGRLSPTVGAFWRRMGRRLGAAGLDNGLLDARLICGFVLGLDATGLVRVDGQAIGSQQQHECLDLLARRLNGEPVARLLGKKEFMGLDFRLSEHVLVPRPETELLVERGIRICGDMCEDRARRTRSPVRFVELGVGSGCIGISLLVNVPHAMGVGVDISAGALEMARINAADHGVLERLDLRAGDWWGPVGETGFDLILSNPPYIARAAIDGLSREVREHDPLLALDGGGDGLCAYRKIIDGAGERLNGQGVLLLEIGFDQGAAVSRLCRDAGFGDVRVVRDLSGQDRMVEARDHGG